GNRSQSGHERQRPAGGRGPQQRPCLGLARAGRAAVVASPDSRPPDAGSARRGLQRPQPDEPADAEQRVRARHGAAAVVRPADRGGGSEADSDRCTTGFLISTEATEATEATEGTEIQNSVLSAAS